jgi:hypothetical protein
MYVSKARSMPTIQEQLAATSVVGKAVIEAL